MKDETMDDNRSVSRYDNVVARLKEQHASDPQFCGLTLENVGEMFSCTMGIMFPHFAGCPLSAAPLSERLLTLESELGDMLCCLMDESDAPAIVFDFINILPDIADQCRKDARALVEGDPAAVTVEEVILSYPGFYAVAAYRVANWLLKAGVPLLPRLVTEFAHQRTGIDIHPGATIGKSFFIDHGTAVVIGETAVIGDNVKVYQGVTLGGLRVDKSGRNQKRHPTIENNVVIYANATILGGDTVIGECSVIGGNVWLTRSVPANSRVMFQPSHTEEMISYDCEIDGSGI